MLGFDPECNCLDATNDDFLELLLREPLRKAAVLDLTWSSARVIGFRCYFRTARL